MKRTNLLAIVGILGLFVAFAASGQTSGNPPATQASSPTRVRLPILYRESLAYQSHLDAAAAALQAQGKDGNWLRNHFQEKLGFSDQQFASVRQTAVRLAEELKAQDAKAKAIIDAIHAQYPRTITDPSQLPPVPLELIALQKGRDAIVAQEIANLKTALGASAASKLDSFLEHNFAPTVTVKFIGPPRPHDPAQHPIAPFMQETQQ